MTDVCKLCQLPGMKDHDFDYCQCGHGWPMGSHHRWDCPAHCICGKQNGPGATQQTCCYHRGGSGRVPVGPSVMTERWDLIKTAEGAMAAERERKDHGMGPRLVKRASSKI